MISKIHSHHCPKCAKEWQCKDNRCPFHGVMLDDPAKLIESECSTCDLKTRETNQLKPESKDDIPTKPTQSAIDETNKLLKAINAKIGYVFGEVHAIDKIDPQILVDEFHKARIIYQRLDEIRKLATERKIIVRLKSESEYDHKKARDKKAKANAKTASLSGLTPEQRRNEKQIQKLMSLPGVTRDMAESMVKAAIAKGSK